MQRNGSSRSLPGDGALPFADDLSSPSKNSRSTRDLRRELQRDRSKITIRSYSARHVRVDIALDGSPNRTKHYRETFTSRRLHVAQGFVFGICIAYLVVTMQDLYGRIATLPVDRHSNLPKLLRKNPEKILLRKDEAMIQDEVTKTTKAGSNQQAAGIQTTTSPTLVPTIMRPTNSTEAQTNLASNPSIHNDMKTIEDKSAPGDISLQTDKPKIAEDKPTTEDDETLEADNKRSTEDKIRGSNEKAAGDEMIDETENKAIIEDAVIHGTNDTASFTDEILEAENEQTSAQILLSQPFTGAKDSQGNFGYVANTTTHAAESIFDDGAEMENVCSVKPGGGIEGKGGWNTLVNRVVVDNTADRHPRVLCTIYTHATSHDKVAAIAKTWGGKCDGFWAASTETDESINAVNLSHEGEEAYINMWQKTRSILAYNYKNYINDYDYFYLAGDDTYLIAENLRKYLLEYEANPHSPYLLAGHYMITKSLYIGGGGGYVINREALKKFVEGGALERCFPHAVQSAEDRFISTCMERDGIPLADTADSHGRQRFFSRDPGWFSKFTGKGGPFAKVYALWERQHGVKNGASVISTSAISFHLIKGPIALKRLHAILYHSCPVTTILEDSLNKAIQIY